MTAMIMVMWIWTAQIKFCHQTHLPAAGLATTNGAGDPLPGITITLVAHGMTPEIDLGSATPNPNPTTTAIGAAATTIHIGVNQDHPTGLLTAISCVIEAPALTATAVIHPIADIPLADMSPRRQQISPRIPKTPLQTDPGIFIIFTLYIMEV